MPGEHAIALLDACWWTPTGASVKDYVHMLDGLVIESDYFREAGKITHC